MNPYTLKTRSRALFAASLLVTLAACGGGGGSSSQSGNSAETPTTPPPTGSVTPENSAAVASASYKSALGLLNSTFLGLDVAANPSGSTTPLATASPMGMAVPNLRLSMKRGLAGIPVGAASNQTEVACSKGGTLLLSVTDVNGNQDLDAGDSLSIDYRLCATNTAISNGKVDFRVTEYSQTSAESIVDVTLTYTALNIRTTGGLEYQYDGDIRLRAIESTSNNSTQMTVSGTRYAYRINNRTVTLSNYNNTVNIYGDQTFEYTVRGVVADSADSEAFTISTPTPLRGMINGNYPRSGKLQVAGSRTGTLAVTVREGTPESVGVLLQLDAGNDGVFEWSKSLTWAELEAS